MQRKIVVKADKLPASCEVKLKMGYTATIEVVDEVAMIIKTGLSQDYVYGRHGFFYTKQVVNAGSEFAKEVKVQVTGIASVRDFGLKQLILKENGQIIEQKKFGNGLSIEKWSVVVDPDAKTIVFKVCKGVDMSKHSHIEATCYTTGDRVRLAFM